MDQYKFDYHTLISARFYKIKEEDRRSDETDWFIISNINHNLMESDINNINVKSHWEHQNQNQETKDSDWVFDKNNSRKIRLFKTGELNGSSYVNIPLRSNTNLKKRKIKINIVSYGQY